MNAQITRARLHFREKYHSTVQEEGLTNEEGIHHLLVLRKHVTKESQGKGCKVDALQCRKDSDELKWLLKEGGWVYFRQLFRASCLTEQHVLWHEWVGVLLREKHTHCNNFIQKRGWAYFREITVKAWRVHFIMNEVLMTITFKRDYEIK